MIPQTDELLIEQIEEESLPTRTHALQDEYTKIYGYVDDVEAMKQAIWLILNIERYDWLIYSWNYGIELKDLFGQQIPYVLAELERRITEALLQDDRIESVTDFEMSHKKHRVACTFTVNTIYGAIEASKEVEF